MRKDTTTKLPKFVQRPASRKKARKEERKRKAREWSANRPKVDDVDLTIVQQMGALVASGSAWEQADTTGLSQKTIYTLRNPHRGYAPRFTTLQMIARARGGRMAFIKD